MVICSQSIELLVYPKQGRNGRCNGHLCKINFE